MKMFARSEMIVAMLFASSALAYPPTPERHSTTAGSIAIANLDAQIASAADDEAGVELLLARSRYLSDYEALDHALAIAERNHATGQGMLRATQAYAATHQFVQALNELSAAEHAGVDPAAIEAVRAPILIATGHATEVLSQLETQASTHPGYASHSALAIAYAEVGRYLQADELYAQAMADLDTTSPFPYAWINFARGLMWAERAGDLHRGERFYAEALAYLPDFAVANIHMAEIEVVRGDLVPAAARLKRVLARTREPEAMALLGVIQIRMGDEAPGARLIEEARARFEQLLLRQPLAFADHAAEFYLGPGNNAERAWQLARQNLANRETPRAFSLAIKAARSAGHAQDADNLFDQARARFGKDLLAGR